MAASVQQVNVTLQDELESTIASYIAQGFVVSNRTPEAVTLFKKKEFNVIWAVIGFFLCLLPLLVYCIVYLTQNDEMVIVKLAPLSSAAVKSAAGELTWSEDREWWWDGSGWRDTRIELPPAAVISEDQRTWWDGAQWRPVPPEPDDASAPREGVPNAPADA